MIPFRSKSSKELLINKLEEKNAKRNKTLNNTIIFLCIDFLFFFAYETIDVFYLEYFSRSTHVIIYSIKVIVDILIILTILLSLKCWKQKILLFSSFLFLLYGLIIFCLTCLIQIHIITNRIKGHIYYDLLIYFTISFNICSLIGKIISFVLLLTLYNSINKISQCKAEIDEIIKYKYNDEKKFFAGRERQPASQSVIIDYVPFQDGEEDDNYYKDNNNILYYNIDKIKESNKEEEKYKKKFKEDLDIIKNLTREICSSSKKYSPECNSSSYMLETPKKN